MANYVLCGELNVKGNLLVKGSICEVKSLSSLVKKLEKGGYKDMMELTNNKRTVDNLEVDDLVLVTFDCKEKAILNVFGTCTSMNMEVLE